MKQNLCNTAAQHEWHNARWFRRMAPVYDVAEVLVGHIRKKVADNSSLAGGSRVLDMACGTVSHSIAFAEKGHSVVGVDLSPDMLERAKRKIRAHYDVTFLCQDASHIPFGDSRFDLAAISFGLHDMPVDVGIAVLREMQRVTKSCGQLVIVDYAAPRHRLSSFLRHAIAKTWEGNITTTL